MRSVRIPWSALTGTAPGFAVSVPVKVDWPELRLTDKQFIANAFAKAYNEPEPYPDQSIFEVVIERPSGI